VSKRKKPPCSCEADFTTVGEMEVRVVRVWDRKLKRARNYTRRIAAKRITHRLGDKFLWHWSDQKNLRRVTHDH
jgi:hypothetical protein